MIELTIDKKTVRVPAGTSILEAARTVDIEIPALCYDPQLEVVSACRLCVVEIEGDPRPRTSCSTPVAPGLVVHTRSPLILEIRRELLQLLLDNHPNDCLTCQQAGECLLQQYAYEYGVSFREHDGARRGLPKARYSDTSSPYILRDESKCILCGKCVRTCAVLPERSVLSFAGRGFDTHIAADRDQSLEASSCVSCSRCVVACPVGALIDRRQRERRVRAFTAQERTVVRCKQCDYGCDFEVLRRDDERVVRPLAPARGRPLCLTGRLRVEAEYASKLRRPFIKEEGKEGRRFRVVSWSQALQLDRFLQRIEEVK